MEPLRKALRLPRVNLFIADDTGLDEGRPVWAFPRLDRRAETDVSWAATLDTLR
jgi:hypothetical protein